MTRAKPNCFNALHQLSRRLKQGEKLSAIVANFDNKGPKSVCGLGASESGALVNLVRHLPLECRSIFGRAVAEFGIVKGPVTHAALAALALRVGFQPELVGDDWSVSMRNTEESVIRASKRLVDDFRSAPPGLRKSATANDVAKMARISRAFDLVLAELSSQLPMPAFEAEKAHVINLFEKRVFDDWLFSLSEECPAQIDVSKISELQGIIGKHKASAEQEGFFEKTFAFEFHIPDLLASSLYHGFLVWANLRIPSSAFQNKSIRWYIFKYHIFFLYIPVLVFCSMDCDTNTYHF